MFKTFALLLSTVLFVPMMLLPFAHAQSTSPEGAEVYFINIKDGDTVQSPFLIQFGLRGMGIAPAGIEKENTGHHHLFIDRPPLGKTEEGLEELEYSIPGDENHLHFGKGQTEAMITLPAGQHTLQMVLGDWSHIPHVKPLASDVITVTVK